MGASSCCCSRKSKISRRGRRSHYLVTTSLPFMMPEWPGNEQKKL